MRYNLKPLENAILKGLLFRLLTTMRKGPIINGGQTSFFGSGRLLLRHFRKTYFLPVFLGRATFKSARQPSVSPPSMQPSSPAAQR